MCWSSTPRPSPSMAATSSTLSSCSCPPTLLSQPAQITCTLNCASQSRTSCRHATYKRGKNKNTTHISAARWLHVERTNAAVRPRRLQCTCMDECCTWEWSGTMVVSMRPSAASDFRTHRWCCACAATCAPHSLAVQPTPHSLAVDEPSLSFQLAPSFAKESSVRFRPQSVRIHGNERGSKDR